VLADCYERGVAETVVARPLDERDLDDQRWLHPAEPLHLLRRNAFTPVAALRVGQVGEWTPRRLERPQQFEQRRALLRRQARPNLPGVEQLAPLVVAGQQRVERAAQRRVAADDELLPPIEPHLHPGAAAATGLVARI